MVRSGIPSGYLFRNRFVVDNSIAQVVEMKVQNLGELEGCHEVRFNATGLDLHNAGVVDSAPFR
jgi:hypothetical protein